MNYPPETNSDSAIEKMTFREGTHKVQDLAHMYESGYLNLEPDFQRSSVWKDRERMKLIDSVLKGYPIPAIFLYERKVSGKIFLDVIDGKQRLEAIFRFMGVIRRCLFPVRTVLSESQGEEQIDWRTLQRRNLGHLLNGYNIHIIYVEGALSQIIELFVRINSTGKPLTAQERRHSKFYSGEFLKTATKLAVSRAAQLRENCVLSTNQISRMKHIELISELMVASRYGEVGEKRKALEHAMSDTRISSSELKKASAATGLAINRVFKMFPDVRKSRFVQLSDFYSLVVLVQKWEREGLVLNDSQRNKVAWGFLGTFGSNVDKARDNYRSRAQVPQELEESFRYLQTVLQGTDSSQNRKARERIIANLLASCFESKDARRIYTIEQRRILWQSAKSHACKICKEELTWESFSVDHVVPHSRGGKTTLLNASLLCRSCNAAKGNRTRVRTKNAI